MQDQTRLHDESRLHRKPVLQPDDAPKTKTGPSTEKKPAPFGLSPKLPNQSLAPKPAPERYQTPDPQHSLEPEKAPAPKETPAPEKTPAPKQSPMSNEDGDLDSQTIAPELLKKLREREEKKNAKLPAPNGEKKNETPKPKAPPSKVGPQTQKPPTSEKKPTPPTDPATKRCAFTPGPNDTEYKPDKPDTDLETREMNKRGLNEPDSTPGNRVGFKPNQFPDCPDVINPKHPKHLPASNNTTTNDKCPADVEEWFINQERHWWPLYLPYKAMVGSFAVFATLVEPHYECFMVSSHDIDATKKFLACAQAMGDLLPLGLVGIKAARGIWRAYKSYRTVQRFRRAGRMKKLLELKSTGKLKELGELLKTKPQIVGKETKPTSITNPRRLLGPGKDVITDPKRQLGPGKDIIPDPKRQLGPGNDLATDPIQQLGHGKRNWRFGKHHSDTKWANEMTKRGWTPDDIDVALSRGMRYNAKNNVNPTNPATRYVHPSTGRSVVIDEKTKEILHIGGDGFKY